MEKPLDFTPINHLGAQAMTLANQMGNMRAQEQHMRLQGQQEQIGAMQIQKMMEEEKRQNQEIAYTETPMFKTLPIEAQNQAIDYITKNGLGTYKDGIGMAPRKNMRTFMQDLESNGDKLEQFLVKPMVNKALAENQKAWDTYQKVKEKFDTGQATRQELDVANQQFLTVNQNLQSVTNKGKEGIDRANIQGSIAKLQKSGEWDLLPQDIKRIYQEAMSEADPSRIKTAEQKWMELKLKAKESLTPYQALSLDQKERFHLDTKRAQDDKEARATRKEQQDLVNRYNAEIANLKREYSRRQASTVPMTPEEWNAAKNDIENRYAPAFEEMQSGWSSGKATGGIIAKAGKPVAAKTRQPEGTTKTIGGVTYTVRNGQWVY